MKCNINVLGDNFYGVTVLNVVIALKRKFTCDSICLSVSYLDYCRLNTIVSNKLVIPAAIRHHLLIIPIHIPFAQLFTDLYRWETYYVMFILETKFHYQTLYQGNRFTKIVHIGDLHKFTNHQKYFHVINIDYVYLVCKKVRNMYIVIDFRYQIY
jgi:hypothetical protein